MFKKLLISLSVITGIAFPFVIYFAIKQQLLNYVLPFIIIVFLLRLCLIKGSKSILKFFSILIIVLAIVLCSAHYVLKDSGAFLYYPVAVNAILFTAFFSSLFYGDSVVTGFAKLTHKNLDDNEINYTRNVTKVWCVFFVLNGAAALYTTLKGDLDMWTLYNGFLSYIIMGSLMGIEFIIRRCFQKRHDSK